MPLNLSRTKVIGRLKQSCRPPALDRGTQYAAAFRFQSPASLEYWVARSVKCQAMAVGEWRVRAHLCAIGRAIQKPNTRRSLTVSPNSCYAMIDPTFARLFTTTTGVTS